VITSDVGYNVKDYLGVFHVVVVVHPHSVHVAAVRRTANHLGMARAITGGGISFWNSYFPTLKGSPFDLDENVDTFQLP